MSVSQALGDTERNPFGAHSIEELRIDPFVASNDFPCPPSVVSTTLMTALVKISSIRTGLKGSGLSAKRYAIHFPFGDHTGA